MATGKNIALMRWNSVGKVMSQIFNMLPRLVIAFLPRSKCLLISWLPPNHLVLCHPLLLFLQSFPASGSFLISQFFTSSGQSVGVSTLASVLPMNIQNGFLLGLTGLILAVQGILKSLFQHYNSKIWILWHSAFFTVQLTSIRGYWKNGTFG